jgi:hypothetical protein
MGSTDQLRELVRDMTIQIPTITLNNGVKMPVARIAELDTGGTLFFDHADPEMVSMLNSRRGD